MEHYAFSTVGRLASQLSMQGMTAALLTTFFLRRIEKYNPTLNAFVTVLGEQAMRDAQASDARRKAGQSLGLLDGIPVAVKDLIDVAGTATTAGSATRDGQISSQTAQLVRRLQAQGAIVIGKTQTVEFAFGGWGTNAHLGTPMNPWDAHRARAPGGSSSGSAVAVAAGLVPCAIGTDTGGSVRIPAAFCSLTGLKMTAGLVDMNGIAPLSPQLDSVGPITRTADDAAILYRALTCEPGQVLDESCHRLLDDGNGLDGMTLAVLPDEQYDTQVQRSVRLGVRDMVRMAEMAGATIVRERPPLSFDTIFEQSGLLMAACGWRLHGALAQNPDAPMDPFVRQRILAGQAVSQMQYEDLLAAHQAAIGAWQAWMADKDAFMIPTLAESAPLLTQLDEATSPGFFTRLANWTGACALALPAGFDPGNMPVSAQLVGKRQGERQLLQIGSVIQSLTAWHSYSPTLQG
ncbi:amidase [Advenella mimigardefordensis]|uniref:Glutamyl-tRNA(Gln) amidotransferase subunit A n=1 Tax=Advenella mimigardefordensis (strain DSM 17166 / LMG 22922 / DPN7) TaxID=1247726 RepID=W0PM77_ADVMD|nr:amidase [Advenella mimigardefordensis]AHG66108.1 glutamyl-tRNA(Gln) amidotransferase subunit A [Advenella mimigardefordensis DPN7]